MTPAKVLCKTARELVDLLRRATGELRAGIQVYREEEQVRGSLTVRPPVHTRNQGGSTPSPATTFVPPCWYCGFSKDYPGTRPYPCPVCQRTSFKGVNFQGHGPALFEGNRLHCLRCGHIADGHIHLSRAGLGVPKDLEDQCEDCKRVRRDGWWSSCAAHRKSRFAGGRGFEDVVQP